MLRNKNHLLKKQWKDHKKFKLKTKQNKTLESHISPSNQTALSGMIKELILKKDILGTFMEKSV